MQKKYLTLDQLQTICCSDKIESVTCFNSIMIINDSTAQVERLIWFLKTLTEYEETQLLAVSDHKGGVNFLWKDIPPRFRDISDFEIPDGDVWAIYHNFTLHMTTKLLMKRKKKVAIYEKQYYVISV